MNYQFVIHSRISQEIIRVVSEQIAFAAECLQGMEDRHEGIHEARKSLKKVRAVLRLSRTALTPETYVHANRTARDLGRLLSVLRDASALIEALDKLKEFHSDWMDEESFVHIRELLEMRRDKLFREMIEEAQTDVKTIESLEVFGQWVAGWRPTQRSFQKAFQPGLETIYAEGVTAFHLAFSHPSAHHFHEWRKRVKDLWYHVLLLEACWPAVMIPFGDTLHLLSDVLGDEHDLNVFHDQLTSGEIPLKSPEMTQQVLSLFDQQITALRGSAFELGQKMYSDAPFIFGNHFAHCWRDAKRKGISTEA
jgi:CHAD domain-containing protein